MNNKTKNYCKWGIAFAIVWNVFILGFYSLMCLSEGVPFTENIEVDSWIGFYFCYALATTVWFYIGYGLRKEYVTKKESHLSAYGNSGESGKNFKLDFIRQYIKLLLSFFIVSMIYYIVMHINEYSNVTFTVNILLFVGAIAACLISNRYISKKIGK